MTVIEERLEDVVEATEVAPSGSPEATRDELHDVDIVVPVYNEAVQLTERITELRRFLDESFPFRALITIVDNGSTDETFAVASQIASSLSGVAVLHLSRKGRGLALRSAWSQSTARVVAYMDVDLSTSLTALLPLVAPLLSGHRDVAFGSRLARGSHVVRGPKRELISRAYNLLLKVSLQGRFSDAQCGFKALRREAALTLLPLVKDDEWFFDTELLVTAERLHMRLSEVPVDWVDDPDSRVSIVPTAIKDLHGIWRISHGQAARVTRGATHEASPADDQVTTDQLLPFAGVGVISTLGFLLLFLAWRPVVGTLAANALALLLCTIFNTTLHWELSHRMHPHSQKRRFVAVAAALFTVSLVLTTAALGVVRVAAGPSLLCALLAVTPAYAAAAVLRFSFLRAWVFRPAPVTIAKPSRAFA
jgi:Glycosyl transferase family 2